MLSEILGVDISWSRDIDPDRTAYPGRQTPFRRTSKPVICSFATWQHSSPLGSSMDVASLPDAPQNDVLCSASRSASDQHGSVGLCSSPQGIALSLSAVHFTFLCFRFHSVCRRFRGSLLTLAGVCPRFVARGCSLYGSA